MRLEPLLARRRVALAGLIAPIVFRRLALAAGICAQLSAVVAFRHLRSNHAGKILAAFLAQQVATGHDCGALEHGSRTAVRTVARTQWGRLTFTAHGIANPTSSGHINHLSY